MLKTKERGRCITLTGANLTVDGVKKIARSAYKVRISKEAMARCKLSHAFIRDCADKGLAVYGVTRGVGACHGRVVKQQELGTFNASLVRGHCTGVGPPVPENEVRAMMAARLNTMLIGTAGCQPSIARYYAKFLNAGIHPLVPRHGSVGEADVTCLAHVGLALMGEGEVFFEGARMDASEALKRAGIKALVLGPRDGLALVGSNAFAAGPGALVCGDAMEALELADLIYALSLEAFRGSMAPLDLATHGLRPFWGQAVSARVVSALLEGSYLHDLPSPARIQDPLSYRVATQVHGAARDVVDGLAKQMAIQLNSSEDNPCVLASEKRVVPCGNFEPLPWVLAFETLGQAICHVSKLSCFRSVKMSMSEFTDLPETLAPPEATVGFNELQKTFTSLHNEIRHLANPASADFFSIAADMEDHATNAPFVVRKTALIVENLRRILGAELLVAAQAVDLREGSPLGRGTKEIHELLRSRVPFLKEDRPMTQDLEEAYRIIVSGEALRILRKHASISSFSKGRSIT